MPTLADIRAKYPQYEDLSDDQLAQGMHRKFYADMSFDDFAKRIQYSPIPAPDVNALDVGGSMVAQAAQGTGDVANSLARTSGADQGVLSTAAGALYGMAGDFLTKRSADVREFAGQAASAITSAVGFGDETAEDVYRRTSADTPEMQRSRKENVITGDITSPSTVSLGTNPTAYGMATNIGDTAARMAPVIVGARINPLLGMAGGGMQGYEGARTEEADRIGNLPREQIVAMPRFRELVAEETGKPFEDGYAEISAASSRLFDGPGTDEDKAIAAAGARALQRLKDEAGNASGLASVPLGMLQGFIFTGKIGGAVSTAVRGTSTGLVGAARAAAGTAAGMTAAGLGEAVTEVGQKVSSAYGATLATGEEGRNLTEDTAADAILGFGMGAGTNVSLPKPKVIDKVFGGAGVNAGDVLGDVGDDTGPVKVEPQPMGPGRAGYTFDEDGNVIEERSGLALPPPGPPPPGTGMGPAGPLETDAANPDFMVDPGGTASAPGDWRAREQARRARSGGPGMGPSVDGAPTMAEPDMAQAAFDSAIESIQATIGRKPTKTSLKATAESVAARFGVDPVALIERNANPVVVAPVDAAVESPTIAPATPTIAPAVPVIAPEVQGEHPNAPQIAPVVAPVPTGKMWRAGKKRLAAQTPDGTWFTRIKQGGRWQPWQKRRNFDPSGAFGYTPFTPPTGNVRINGAIYPVGERTAEATSERAPPDVIDSIIAAGGLNREEAQRQGIDPKLFGTRRGATAWLFPRTGGMTLSALRQRLQDDGYFPAEDPDAPPTISDDDAFEIVQRALNQGDRIVSMNNAGAEAAYQNARQAVETSAIDALDAEAANQFLSQIEADPIAKRVFDQIDADGEAEAMTVMELLERAESAGATPQELRQAYDVLGISGQVTSEQDASRNLWELIRTKEQGNGIDARARQTGRGNGDPAPARGASPAGNDAQRQPADGNQGTVAGRDQPGSGEAAREQAAELERLRARVAELESARSANEVTGLPGKAAFEADESLGWSTVAAIDMDGLGRLNDATSHQTANEVMVAMADAMRTAQIDGVRFYHLHGDELAARFQNPDDAARITLALQDALAAMSVRINLTLENGTVRAYSYDGIGITFGLGANYATADAAAIRSKQEREAAGLRQNKNQPGPPRQLRDLSGSTERRNNNNPGGQPAAGNVNQEVNPSLGLTDDTVVTPPAAERPASQSGLFAPVTDIDRQRLRFEREQPSGPTGQQQVDLEEAIQQTPPSGGVSVLGDENTNPAALAAPTKESRNGISQETAQSEERTETAQAEERAQPGAVAQRQQAEAGANDGEAASPRSRARRTRAPVSTARAELGGEGSRVANAADAADDAADSIAGQADPGADAGQAGRDAAPTTGETGDGAVAAGTPEAAGAVRGVRKKAESPNKIGDFGEKIGGARKDVWSSFKDQLREVSDDNVLTEPLSKTWPQPDYQKMIDDGADSWVVAFVRSARDEIPRKPNSSWKQKNWATQVKQLRDVSLKLLNGDISADRAKELLAESRGLRELVSRIELYQLVGHAQSLVGVSFDERHYSMYMGRNNVHMWVVEKATAATAFSNWPRELATGDTKEQMLQAFKEKVASLQLNPEKAKVATFDIYSYRGVVGYLIGKKVGRNHIDLAGPFPTVGEARAYRDASNAALVAKLEASKEIPNERRDTNEPRVGEDMRNGQDVTPQMFGDAFGFKGVEFGNWVEQTKRQSDLNEAFDALMDMAAILGIPPKAISLNGELGIAFGARGSGGVKPAAAHYEPGKVVINLTKKNGAGSLGHEWWHALDNYFQRARGKSEYATEALDVSLASRGSPFVQDAKMRKEMVEAFGAVVSAIKNTAIKARSAKLDAKRTKEYWTTGREMAARAFESYLITKLQDQNASNDYLANIVDEATWSVAESIGFELDGSYPYPTAGEVPVISAAFDKFFDTIESREDSDGKVELFSMPEASFAQQVKERLASGNNRGAPLNLGRTPAVLRMLGFPNLPLKMPVGVLFKLATGKNGDRAPLTEIQIAQIPEAIDEAVAVFKNHDGGVLVLTTMVDRDGKPVIVAARPDVDSDEIRINLVPTAFGKDDAIRFLSEQVAAGRLLYRGAKNNPRVPVETLSDRQVRPVSGGQSRTILVADDLRKFREQQRNKASNGAAPGWDVAETATDQLSQAAVDREVAKSQAEFDGVTIEVMDSIQDAPTSDRTKRLYPGANGLTDGASRVWIFRRGMQSLQQLRMTLAHEIIGHIGVERVIGADWPAVVDAIKRIRAGSTLASPAVVNAVKAAESRYPTADDLTFAREAVAIMAENGVTGSLMDRIVAAVRKYLRRVFGSLQWSDAEIRNLLRRAGEAARKPAVFRGAEFEAAEAESEESAGDPSDGMASNPAPEPAATDEDSLASSPAPGPIERKMAEDARSGQPIDRLFRLPFHLFGLDSHGRLKPGTKLYDWLARVLAEKMPAEDGAFGWIGPIIKTVRSGLIDRYGVPQDFVHRDERRESEVRSVLMHAASVAANLEGLTTDEAKVLQAMLTGQEMPVGALGKLSQPIKEAIDQMGREAVEMGLISPEAYARNRGAYLHRSYLKYEVDRTALGKAVGNFLDKRRKKLMGDTLRGRGMTMERNAEAVAAALGGSLAEGDIVTVLRQKTEKGVRTKYQRGPLNGPAPVGWESLGDWRVMKAIGNKAVLWRDFTPEERAKMGEILDARYNITKTFALMAHDLATGRFLRDIAANPEWARAELPEGETAAEAGGRYDTYADSDWVRVPDAAIPGTNDGNGKPVKRWGALAGMYVRAPIWRDLNQLREMQNPQLWGSAWQKIMTFWKTNKTARNPVVHVNNVMSNMMFMDLADIRLRDLYRGIGAWKRGEADEDYRDAMAHGAFGGGFANQELKRKVLQPILDDILAKQKVDGQDTADERLGVLHLLSTIWDGIKKVDGKMLDAYSAEDEVFRLAFYLRRQSLGDTPEEAARAARRQFIDYDIRAPWVNMARNTVLPFIGYTYRSIPILAQAIAERPWKLAKYATMAAAANWLGYLFAPGDEDDERKVMSSTLQGNTWTGTPRMIRMPWFDGDGNPVFLDVRRWIPAGDVFDMNQSEIGVPAWLQFGGPLQIAGELMLNKQAFTKQPIVDPLTDTAGEKAAKVASWAWKAAAPNAPWIPESYSWDKIGQAITGETDELGRDYSVTEATSSVLGVKAAGMDVALQRRYRDREFDRVDRELDFDLSSLKRERQRNKISDARFKAAVAKIVEKKRRLADERRRVLSRSASKPKG